MSFDLPPDMVRRVDESDDALFYAAPRFVAHIDDATREAITEVYRSEIAAGADVLDLMSSWISHLPEEAGYGRVAGQGMNLAELERNPRLTERVVHDLNAAPEIPFENDAFDVVLNAVSVQYLTQPVAVFRSVARVLRPGGKVLIAISHRLFPTKAIYAWQALPPNERAQLVEVYLERCGAFGAIETLDHSPPGADPLWIVRAIAR